MIDNLLIHVCTIWRVRDYADADPHDGAEAATNYDAFSIDEPCLVRFTVPWTEIGAEQGSSEIVKATVRLKTEVYASDRIEYDGNFYKIETVQRAQSFITEEVQYYTASVERERAATLNNTLAIV